MKLLVDENIPLMTVKELLSKGFDVKDIRGTLEEGISDDKLWEIAQTEQRLLITTDKGFSNNRNELHHGILIIRLKQPNRKKIHQRVIQGIYQYVENEWPGLMLIMRDSVQSTWHAQQNKH